MRKAKFAYRQLLKKYMIEAGCVFEKKFFTVSEYKILLELKQEIVENNLLKY